VSTTVSPPKVSDVVEQVSHICDHSIKVCSAQRLYHTLSYLRYSIRRWGIMGST